MTYHTSHAGAVYYARPGITRAEFRAENVSCMGRNPRTRWIVPESRALETHRRMMDRYRYAFRDYQHARPFSQADRRAMKDALRGTLARALALAPAPRLP